MECFYCNNPAHTIARCNARLLRVMYHQVVQSYLPLLTRYDDDGHLRDWLRNEVHNCHYLYVSFCNRYCGAIGTYLATEMYVNRIHTHMTILMNECRFNNMRPDALLHIFRTYVDNPTSFQEGDCVNEWGIPVDLVGQLERAASAEHPRHRNNRMLTKYNITGVTCSVKTKKTETFECPICLDDKHRREQVLLDCGHAFCGGCMKAHLKASSKHPTCALCRNSIQTLNFVNQSAAKKFRPFCTLMLTDTKAHDTKAPETNAPETCIIVIDD